MVNVQIIIKVSATAAILISLIAMAYFGQMDPSARIWIVVGAIITTAGWILLNFGISPANLVISVAMGTAAGLFLNFLLETASSAAIF